jgi:hypothetical protein
MIRAYVIGKRMCINLILVKTTEKFWPIQSILSGQMTSWAESQIIQSARLSVPSSELGPIPTPLTRKRVLLSTLGSKAGDTPAGGEGVGGPCSDEGADTLVLYVYQWS